MLKYLHILTIILLFIYCLCLVLQERFTVSNKRNGKLKRHIKRHWFPWTALVVASVIGVTDIVLANSVADIRGVPYKVMPKLPTSQPVPNDDKECFYHFYVTSRFKNLSLKKGFVNGIEFKPVSQDLKAEFKVASIENNTELKRGEEQEIKVNYTVSFDYNMCSKRRRGESIMWDITFRDNTGKLIKGINDEPFGVHIILPPF